VRTLPSLLQLLHHPFMGARAGLTCWSLPSLLLQLLQLLLMVPLQLLQLFMKLLLTLGWPTKWLCWSVRVRKGVSGLLSTPLGRPRKDRSSPTSTDDATAKTREYRYEERRTMGASYPA
jgi:hypothetical protein